MWKHFTGYITRLVKKTSFEPRLFWKQTTKRPIRKSTSRRAGKTQWLEQQTIIEPEISVHSALAGLPWKLVWIETRRSNEVVSVVIKRRPGAPGWQCDWGLCGPPGSVCPVRPRQPSHHWFTGRRPHAALPGSAGDQGLAERWPTPHKTVTRLHFWRRSRDGVKPAGLVGKTSWV